MNGGTSPSTGETIDVTLYMERYSVMDPHVHFSPVHAIAMLALLVAVMGSLHLLALSTDNRASRALVSLGF